MYRGNISAIEFESTVRDHGIDLETLKMELLGQKYDQVKLDLRVTRADAILREWITSQIGLPRDSPMK